MTKIATKAKKHINASLQQRDANGRFAPAKRPVGRPRKEAVKNSLSTFHRPTINPIGSFGYDDDAVELPSKPFTSQRVRRNMRLKQIERRVNDVTYAIIALTIWLGVLTVVLVIRSTL